jgi:hypothetical protein
MTELVARVHQIETGRARHERGHFVMGLREQVRATLTLLRTNLSQAMVGEFLGVSQSTISRVYRHVLPLVEQATCLSRQDLAEAAAGRIVLVDGTYVPTQNRTISGRTNYSGKHHVQCLNVQVAAATDGTLLAVSDPVPGARHDSAALDLVGWAAILDDVEWIADTAYIAHSATTPIKKTRGEQRTDSDKNWNKTVASIRAAVERTISHLKNWKILATGYRGRLNELPRVIRIVTNLELYRLGW